MYAGACAGDEKTMDYPKTTSSESTAAVLIFFLFLSG
jgi:hypothetical protein